MWHISPWNRSMGSASSPTRGWKSGSAIRVLNSCSLSRQRRSASSRNRSPFTINGPAEVSGTVSSTRTRVLAEIANQMRGTPIKLVFSREEDFLQDIPRQISIARYQGSVDNGKIVAADLKLA